MSDFPLLSALVGLGGVAVGGVSTFATTWLTQLSTAREKRRQVEAAKRERLFNDFVIEASHLYADALANEKDDLANFVQLYSLIGRMRLICSQEVVDAAERTMRSIIEAYMAPNRTLMELLSAARSGALDPLAEFDEAGRVELTKIWGEGRH